MYTDIYRMNIVVNYRMNIVVNYRMNICESSNEYRINYRIDVVVNYRMNNLIYEMTLVKLSNNKWHNSVKYLKESKIYGTKSN